MIVSLIANNDKLEGLLTTLSHLSSGNWFNNFFLVKAFTANLYTMEWTAVESLILIIDDNNLTPKNNLVPWGTQLQEALLL
jgi:hypothetical protein